MGYRAFGGPAKAPLTVVPSTQSQPAAVLAVDALGEVQLQVPRPLAYRCCFPAFFAGAEGTVVGTDASSVHVAFGASLSTCQGTLSQTVHLCTAEELHDGFAAYWADFWTETPHTRLRMRRPGRPFSIYCFRRHRHNKSCPLT